MLYSYYLICYIEDLLGRQPAILRRPAVSEHAARVTSASVLAKVRLP